MIARRRREPPFSAPTFLSDRRGTSAVEFGIVAGPLVLVLLGVLQLGFYYFVQASLDAGVLKAGQSLYNGFRTGSAAYAPNAATLKSTVAAKSGGMVANNGNLAVEIQPIGNLSAASVPITDGVNNYGTTTSTLVLRAKATVPAFAPFLGTLMSATSAVIVRRQGT